MIIKNKKQNRAFSTIELLIAFAILLINITGIVMLSDLTPKKGMEGTALLAYQGQSVSVDSETNQEAIQKAKQQMEEARAQAKNDFTSVDSIGPISEMSGPLEYTKELVVSDLSPCLKNTTSSVSWNTASPIPKEIEFSTLLGDVASALALGGDCASTPPGDWDNPGGLVSEPIGGQGATSIDAINNRLFVTSNKFPPLNNKDFFVYDFDPDLPSFVSPSLSLVAELDLNEGLNDVDVAKDYAYVASASVTGELQVIDLATMARIDAATRQLPGTTTAKGKRVFFYNDKVYMGTDYLPCPPPCLPSQNNEFHIYDVSTPSDPVWEGSVDINHNVNDIFVQGNFAYLATSDIDHELMVININPSSSDYLMHPDDTGFGYNASGSNDGYSVYVLGDKVYLGRIQNTPSSADDFFVLNKSNTEDGASISDGLVNSKDLGIQNNALVTGIVVKGRLVFIGLDDSNYGLMILDLSTMLPPSACAGFNFPENSTSMDMNDDFIFTSNRSNDEIRVIYDQPTVCTP